MYKIPLSSPSIEGNEWEYVKKCLDTEWISSAGQYVNAFEEKVADYTGSKYAIACVNGTSAIQVSLRMLGVSPGDEVIVPTLTFIAPINAVYYNHAKPVFMDCDKYYNINIEKTISFIQKETFFKDGHTYNKLSKNKISAIIPVHVWGNAVWLDELLNICEERNIAILEDASESLGTYYTKGSNKDKHAGTIGRVGCVSFNGNKIISTGGGGMIITDDYNLANKAKYLTTQAKDDPVKYIHNEVGYNFRLSNIQAAIGVAQLEKLPEFLKRKRETNKFYQRNLFKMDGIKIAETPDYAHNNCWLNILQISDYKDISIENLMERFTRNGIETRPVWKLNHLQRPYIDCQSYEISLASKLIRLSLCMPSSVSIKKDELYYILDIMNS